MNQYISRKEEEQVYYAPSKSVYENTLLIAKRAKQVVSQRRASFIDEIEEFQGEDSLSDTIEDTSYREQLSKKYEKMPKPVMAAMQDVQDGHSIVYTYHDVE